MPNPFSDFEFDDDPRRSRRRIVENPFQGDEEPLRAAIVQNLKPEPEVTKPTPVPIEGGPATITPTAPPVAPSNPFSGLPRRGSSSAARDMDVPVEHARSAVFNHFLAETGREPTDMELDQMIRGQGWQPGDRYVGQRGLSYIRDQVSQNAARDRPVRLPTDMTGDTEAVAIDDDEPPPERGASPEQPVAPEGPSSPSSLLRGLASPNFDIGSPDALGRIRGLIGQLGGGGGGGGGGSLSSDLIRQLLEEMSRSGQRKVTNGLVPHLLSDRQER